MISAIIIENEQSACEALQQTIAHWCPEVQVVATASGIRQAVTLIHTHQPTLVFLDIELDSENGIQLFEHFPQPAFDVIFTTAHSEFALQAIKLSCVDYLLKPIDYRDLLVAIQKFKLNKSVVSKEQLQSMANNLSASISKKLVVSTATGYEFLNIEEIIMACADGNYTTLFTIRNKIVSSKNLGEYEEMLPGKFFFRCHKSYLINLNFIEKFDRTLNYITMEGGLKAELALRKREEFFDRIKK